MIDIHSHVLPNIDDGSKSPEMSLNMLKESHKQGISAVVATPHFYIKNDTVDSFLINRSEAYNRLMEFIKDEVNIPDIYLGAEVYYFNGISRMDNIESLCINNSNYLLLEMPFSKWNSRVFQEVEDLIYNRKLIPVIAHLERFTAFQNGTDNIEKLLSMRVIAQMNAEHLLGFFTKGKAIKWLSKGVIRLLGSDMHNTETRPQNLGNACKIVSKKLGNEILDEITELSKEIIGID
ncbi:MAG: capsular polysaccharide biosynthesis protein [Clostridia bacterium]|nr:capsular polysaccharide biosynthesis protein [Clostridia bacterium]